MFKLFQFVEIHHKRGYTHAFIHPQPSLHLPTHRGKHFLRLTHYRGNHLAIQAQHGAWPSTHDLLVLRSSSVGAQKRIEPTSIIYGVAIT